MLSRGGGAHRAGPGLGNTCSNLRIAECGLAGRACASMAIFSGLGYNPVRE